MKPERDFDVILTACLDALQRGVSLETILAQYPDEASRLQPILKNAQFVTRTPNPTPPCEAVANSKTRMIEGLIEKQTKIQQKKKAVLEHLGMHLGRNQGKCKIIWILSLALAFILFSTLAVCTAESLPGCWLYPVKLAVQDLHVFLTLNPEARVQLITFYCWCRQQDLLAAVEQQHIPEAEAWATLTAMPMPAPTWTIQE